MAIECKMAKSRRWRWGLYLALCIGGGGWCFHDGWMSEKYKDDASNLWFNRVAAVALGAGSVILIVGFVIISGTRVVADDDGIDVNGKFKIAWSDITEIDDDGYEKGLVEVTYADGGESRRYMIDSHKLDRFDELLDEVSRHRPDMLAPAEEEPPGPETDAEEGQV